MYIDYLYGGIKMGNKIEKIDWLFLLLCLFVGIVAEETFTYEIGVSYLIFIAAFYLLFFFKFRSFSFTHQRIGYLILLSIWILAISYFLYDTTIFYLLNGLAIPALVIFHLVLITSPKKKEWSQVHFITYILQRIIDSIRYNAIFTKHICKLFKQSSNEKQYDIWRKVIIGIIIAIPFLFVIINLLISADAQFERLLSNLPQLINIRADYLFRTAIIIFFTFSFFGFMQVLLQKNAYIVKKEEPVKAISIDGVITLTILLLLNIVYILFVIIQFKYFFSGTLDEGYTYAEYARRGFFELLFITMINLTVTTGVIYFTNNISGILKRTIRIALTILVISSGVILISAFMRLSLYEDAYGFTFTRVLAHSFMIFLMIIFTYTLVKIWLDKLSLFHFYFISSLIYYTGINIINFDNFVVDRNIERFEETGKIDIYYLNQLSATGILGLIEIYEKNGQIPELEEMLKELKEDRGYLKNDSWQSYNVTRDKAFKKLGELDIE